MLYRRSRAASRVGDSSNRPVSSGRRVFVAVVIGLLSAGRTTLLLHTKHYPGDLLEPYLDHIRGDMFHGFDFDITTERYVMRNTPGVELRSYFGSAAAKMATAAPNTIATTLRLDS